VMEEMSIRGDSDRGRPSSAVPNRVSQREGPAL
jgi:hypothetical protein